jgi:hypothetical protein
MPTYKNNRQALLFIEAKSNAAQGAVDSRSIGAGAVFTAKTADVPVRWLEQGSPLEGAGPWVTMLSESPTDEELSD